VNGTFPRHCEIEVVNVKPFGWLVILLVCLHGLYSLIFMSLPPLTFDDFTTLPWRIKKDPLQAIIFIFQRRISRFGGNRATFDFSASDRV